MKNGVSSGNHLTFMIYNHIAMFDREWWPRSIRVNGHLLLNSAKSKLLYYMM